MPDPDTMIEEALGTEESEFLRQIRTEPIFIERAFGMFGAGVRWTARAMVVVQLVLFGAGAWAAWKFFESTEPTVQLRWGLPAAVLVLMSVIVKMAIAPALQNDQLMRELKRIELQIARARRPAG